MHHPLYRIIRAHREGSPVGVTSVCSAHPWVLEAALRRASAARAELCVESTSNQVNQHGGYTGMTPLRFAGLLRKTAERAGLDPGRLILGGDHLGPYPWRAGGAAKAMEESHELIRLCTEAGYRKLHLDASMPCADDPILDDGSLAKEIIAERTAELCRTAEAAARKGGSPLPLYVIGTEVPVPGGTEAEEREPSPTTVSDVEETIETVRGAFLARNLKEAWERVAAVVVQPGVEFGDSRVIDYSREKAAALSRYIEGRETLVYEAHSTDYQTAEALRRMVEDHFAVLKVGPALTFAFREAVFALERIEGEWLSGGASLSGLGERLEAVMLRNPEHWRSYYRGEEAAFLRRFSYSDRSRYYWAREEVDASLRTLLRNLSERPIPLSLISQYLPVQHRKIREGKIAGTADELIRARICDVLDDYFLACGVMPATPPRNEQLRAAT